MNSVVAVKKEVHYLQARLMPRPDDTIILHMWLPKDNPKHDMTDDKIIAEGMRQHKRVIIMPREMSQNVPFRKIDQNEQK